MPGVTKDLPDNRWRSRRFAIDITGDIHPFEGQVDDSPRSLDLFQRRKRRLQHGQLSGRIAGPPQGTSQGIFDGSNAWRADCQGYVRDRRQQDGGKSRGFDFALCQSNGPAADRSGRHKDNHIGVLSAQVADNGRDRLVKQCFRLKDVAHD